MRILAPVASVLLVVACAVPASGQAPAKDPRKLEYVARLADTEIGRETVEITDTGWKAKGKYDVLGQQKGSFAGTLVHKDVGFTLEFVAENGGPKRTVLATFDGKEFVVGRKGSSRKRKVAVKGANPFVYGNLMWCTMIDLGRLFARLHRAGKLAEGTELTALLCTHGAQFTSTHKTTEVMQQTAGGKTLSVRVSRFVLSGSVEVVLVCTMDGLPLRIEIPSQQIGVTAKGFEGLRGERKVPTSPVDKGPWRKQLSQPQFEYEVRKKTMIRMRDGVSLAADIYIPKGKGPWPAILARTPYNRQTEGGLKGAYYARRGYIFVAQDVRGRFDSEGEWFPFVHEEKDGSDTIDFIATRDDCTGKVGMIGASYVGLVQWFAAKSGNKNLTCIVPQVSPPDPHENFPYEGGAFLMGAAWWAKVLDSMKMGTDWRKGLNWEAMYKTLPLGNLDQALNLKEKTFLDEWLKHPPHDQEFWEHAYYQDRFHTIDVPALHISGWWDGDQPGAVMNYVGMTKSAKTEAARKAQYLVMGPWTHFFNTQRKVGRADYGEEAIVDLDSRILRFFDHYLKGVPNGIAADAHVHLFTMGSNQWHTETDYPVPGTKWTKVYVSSNGNAHRRDGDGRLSLELPTGKASGSYKYDPSATPSLEHIDFTDTSGKYATADRSVDEDREDDLDFTSPPLATDCEILGPIKALLHVSTDAADTDFGVGLFRVSPKGEMFTIRGGFQRLRYAKNPKEDHPVKPGTVTRIEVDCWATGLRLRKGERLRVVVTSWSWPGYGRNLNTLESPLTAKKGVVATNTVYHDKARPSHILLPVVPRDGAPGLRFEAK